MMSSSRERYAPSRTSTPRATRWMGCSECMIRSAKVGMSVVGRLSTQKNPMSSKHLIAKLLPAPLSPVMTTNDRGAGIALGSGRGLARRAAGSRAPPARPRLAHLSAEAVDVALHGCQQMVGARRDREAALARARDEPCRPLEPLRAAGDPQFERRRPDPRELLDLPLDQGLERRRQHHPAPAAGASPLPRRETPLVRGQDAELLAVLGDRAARDREATLLERLRDFLVGLRLCRVFGGQDVLDHLLDRDRRYHLPVARRDAAVEEELQLEQPLRGFDVLVRRDAADRRFVHPDVLADIAQR